ncbi:VHS1033 protein [Vibrio phage 1]|nr:VHS1033 protein [Vibrio phage 1]
MSSDVIPTDQTELQKQIDEMLTVTPPTSERGRLFHLLNQAVKNAASSGGDSGGGSNAVTNAIQLGTFTISPDGDNVPAQQCFLNRNQLIFSNQVGESPGDRLPFSYTGLVRSKDFDYILTGQFGGGAFNMYIDSFTTHNGSTDNDRTFVGHNTMIPPLPPGTSVTIHAVPKTKGSNNPYGTSAGLLFDLRLVDVSTTDAATFNSENISAIPFDAGFNQPDLSTNNQMFLKVPQETWDLINTQFQGNILSAGTATATIVVYDRGVFQGAIFGFFDSTRSYDADTDIMTLTFENNAVLSPRTLTMSNDSAFNVRVFVDYGA